MSSEPEDFAQPCSLRRGGRTLSKSLGSSINSAGPQNHAGPSMTRTPKQSISCNTPCAMADRYKSGPFIHPSFLKGEASKFILVRSSPAIQHHNHKSCSFTEFHVPDALLAVSFIGVFSTPYPDSASSYGCPHFINEETEAQRSNLSIVTEIMNIWEEQPVISGKRHMV